MHTSAEIELLKKKVAELESKLKEKDEFVRILNEKLSKAKYYIGEALKELS
jgi:peptidoglycan hydrolase CwlO-like protein